MHIFEVIFFDGLKIQVNALDVQGVIWQCNKRRADMPNPFNKDWRIKEVKYIKDISQRDKE